MSVLIITITTLLFGIGILGTIIPGLPGIGLVYAGVLVYAFADGFTTISISTTVYLGVLTLIAALAQYAGSVWGAQSAGGKKKALVGTFLGAFLGVFTGPLGIFIGAFLGALIGALLEGKNPEKAVRIAFLSVVGIVGGSIIQFFLSLALVGAFIIAILA